MRGRLQFQRSNPGPGPGPSSRLPWIRKLIIGKLNKEAWLLYLATVPGLMAGHKHRQRYSSSGSGNEKKSGDSIFRTPRLDALIDQNANARLARGAAARRLALLSFFGSRRLNALAASNRPLHQRIVGEMVEAYLRSTVL
jgi:hypothetical protein